MTSYLRTLRLFNRNVRLYLLVAGLMGLTVYGGINAVVFNLYVLRLGYGPEFVGVLNASSWLALAVFSLPAGRLGRRFGPRRLMIGGQALIAASLCLLPLATFLAPAPQRAWLYVTYAFMSVGIAGSWVNASPFLMGSTNPTERSHAFSAQFALTALVAFAGALFGGVAPGLWGKLLGVSLASALPYACTLILSAALVLPTLPALLATREVTDTYAWAGSHPTAGAPLGLAAVMAVVMFLSSAGLWSAQTFFNVYLDAGLRLPTSLVGVLQAGGQVLAGPAALLTPVLVLRLGSTRTCFLAQLGAAICLLPLALISRWAAAGAGFMGMLTMAAIANPAMTEYQQSIVRPTWRGPMSGAVATAVSAGAAASAFAGGYVITALGFHSLFLAGAGLTAGGALLFWAYFRVPRGEFARGAEAQARP